MCLCVQAREQLSTEEEENMKPGHHWLGELGNALRQVNGTTCEKQFKLSTRAWKDYKGTRFNNGEFALRA